MIRIGTRVYFLSSTPIWSRCHQQLDDLAGEATQAIDKGVKDLGNVDENARTEIGKSFTS